VVDALEGQEGYVAAFREITLYLGVELLLSIDGEDQCRVETCCGTRDLAATRSPYRHAPLVPRCCLIVERTGDDGDVLPRERRHVGRSLLAGDDESAGKRLWMALSKLMHLWRSPG
jgi:hypothetical protein